MHHTIATLMLEGGADIRFIQEMLGHSKLSSTQMYTQVSVRMLKQIHTATRPAAQLHRAPAAAKEGPSQDQAQKAELLATLDAEAEKED